jgi:hypothetical protein
MELWRISSGLLSTGFLTVLQKASPATQQLMALENKFIAMFHRDRS